MDADIVIVGAGMVGSTLALALAHSNLQICLIDGSALEVEAFDSDAAFEPRVSALSEASRRILKRLGAWDGILRRRASPYERMCVWEGLGTGEIQFTASSAYAEVLGHIVENRVVQDALLDQLQKTSVQLRGRTHLEQAQRTAGGWQLRFRDGSEISTRLLIGADGAHSSVRKLLNWSTREWDYLHHAIVTSIRCERPHQLTAWQRFAEDGPLALLPLQRGGDEHWCSIVWSALPERATQLMAMSEAGFREAVGEYFEYRLGRVEDSLQRFAIPLRQRHAKRYVDDAVALIGDAAHTIHPLAGQGVNLGFLDAAVLAEVILSALERGECFASRQTLSRFERRRMPENLAMMAAMEGFQRLFQANPLPIRWLRSQGLSFVNRQPELKNLFMRRALGLAGDMPDLARTG